MKNRVVLLTTLIAVVSCATALADTITPDLWDPILSIQGTSGGAALNVLNSGNAYSLQAVLNGTQTLAVTNPTASFSYLITNDTGAAVTNLTFVFTGTYNSNAVWNAGKAGTYGFDYSVSSPPPTWIFSNITNLDAGDQFLVWFQSFEVPNASGSVSAPTAIPDPTTLLLLGSGLIGTAFLSWRRR